MAIKEAAAALTSTASITALALYNWFEQGEYDQTTGTIRPIGTNSWSNLAGTTWASWTSYANSFLPIIWTAPVIDVGAVNTFTMNINCDADGDVYFKVYTSVTGTFGGEERETIIENGDVNVPAFYGQYVIVQALTTGRELRRLTMTTDTGGNVQTLRLKNVDTSTLMGTSSARVISLPQTLSAITEIYVQPKAATTYPLNLYVSDTQTSVVTIPVVISKDVNTPTIALYGIDNDPRDAVVDIMITGLPAQAMEGNNLFVIQ